MAFVVYHGQPSFVCSATVVSTNVVLTAGHCLVDTTTGAPYPPSGFEVTTGVLDPTEAAGQVSGVSRTIVYPGFSGSTLDGDAGLLVLSTPANAPPVRLATAAESDLYQPGTEAAIAGWGETQYDAQQLPGTLQWARTVVQSAAYCQQQAGLFDAAKLCAVGAPSFSTATCFGDSGGPLIAYQNSEAVEIGIISTGPSDCATTLPDAFTRADLISPWTAGWIAAVVPVASPPAPQTGSVTSRPSTRVRRRLTSRTAASYARQALSGVFGGKLSHGRRYHAQCSRSASAGVTCAVRWGYGPELYRGTVSVSYQIAAGGTRWAAAYRVSIENKRCGVMARGRRSCLARVVHGTWKGVGPGRS
jgi:secreted trypsin-like serine protease